MSAATRFVIIGAGPAGMRAAEVLRAQVPEADVLLIGDEPHLPYQRPPLSKAFLTGGLEEHRLPLKPESFYAAQRIQLRLGSAAIRIDRGAKKVELADGARIPYDRLLIATGCRCRTFPASLVAAPVHYLRDLNDARKIKAALAPGAEIVLIGGGFIGLELAASVTKLGAKVTVIEAAPRLMVRAMPAIIGDFARDLHEQHGVRFVFEAKLIGIDSAPDGREIVRTERAEYPCDMVVVGIGAEPNVALAAACGLAIEDGIRVNACGRTNDPDIFAAGDVTRHDNPLLGEPIRIESWQVALNHAAAVARCMLGASEPYAEMPWMWTDQYDCNIQMLGIFRPEIELVLRGEPAAHNFTLFGLDGNAALVAAVAVNTGRDMAVLRRLHAAKIPLAKDLLAEPGRKLSEFLKPVARAV